jgi:hypothetical protein
MPRYLFHFVSDEDCSIPDHDGVVLTDINAAHRHATRLINRTVPFMAGQNLRHWRIDVADETNRTLLTVLFPATFPTHGTRFGRRDRIPATDAICLR